MTKKEVLQNLQEVDQIFEGVMSQIELPQDDEVYYIQVRDLLEQQTYDFLEIVIYKHMSAKQVDHFKDYVHQYGIIVPGIDELSVMLEFIKMYKDLSNKVGESLAKFFKTFIENYKNISVS